MPCPAKPGAALVHKTAGAATPPPQFIVVEVIKQIERNADNADKGPGIALAALSALSVGRNCHNRSELPQPLDNARRALAATDAHGDQAIAPATPLQLIQRLHRELRARAAERVTERNRAAIHVHLFLVHL